MPLELLLISLLAVLQKVLHFQMISDHDNKESSATMNINSIYSEH